MAPVVHTPRPMFKLRASRREITCTSLFRYSKDNGHYHDLEHWLERHGWSYSREWDSWFKR